MSFSPYSIRLLLVEDDRATNSTLTRLLSRRFPSMVSAMTVGVALEAAKNVQFDLVISDIRLPDGDGWSLIKEIRALQPDLRAIALTGFGYPADLTRSEVAGFDAHLTKPVTLQNLEACITSLFPEGSKGRLA